MICHPGHFCGSIGSRGCPASCVTRREFPLVSSKFHRQALTMRSILLAFLSVLGTAIAPAESSPQKILFIGNSYTGQIKETVVAFIAATPHKATQLSFITPGGRTLEQHLANPKTIERIASGGWDVVVLQDQSQTPAIAPDKFMTSSAKLHAAITKSGARTVYYETWGRRDGDQKNATRFPTYESMQKALSASYRAAARRDGASLAPVGTAWQQVRREQTKLGRKLYKNDGSHPSASGALLAAACFYATLFDADPSTISFDGDLPAKEAAYLRKVAAQAK